ncbi:MAG: hypothetical protein II647_03475, partial [Bacteroidales bacterium]|nr:hypothetical protein [Bacteroidales bacterium]
MMENLTDKNIRGELIARYLEAETDAREETLLAEYFAEHAPEADEAAVARLLLAERPEALLAAGERAFAPQPSTSGRRLHGERQQPSTSDRRLKGQWPERQAGAARRGRRLLWSCAAAAAALALFLLLRPAAQEAPAFTPLEVA